jgi:hypothetical protein
LEAINYYEYLNKYATSISNTALLNREERISNGLNYLTYFNEIKEQQIRSKKYPKYEVDIRPHVYTDIELPEVIRQIQTGEYTYIGVRKIEDEIYEDSLSLERDTLYNNRNQINDGFISGDSYIYSEVTEYGSNNLYWEFYSPSLYGAELDKEYRRFLYVPIRPNLALLLKAQLPFIYNWDSRPIKPLIWNQYPYKEYVINASAEDWPCFYSSVVDDLTHPFVKGFYFTGKMILNAEGTILYEYTDIEGIYGIKDELYTSPLQPIELDFPLGKPKPGDIIYDQCLDSLLGFYPSYGSIPYIGQFTGYISTSSYNPYQTYYLYKRKDGSVFLHPAPPSSYAQTVINIGIELLGLDIGGLLLETDIAIDSIEIEDSHSCGINLAVRDRLCSRYIPLSLSIFNDCNIIGDDFNRDKGIELVDDDALINDEFMFDNGFCKEQLESPFRDLLEDCLVNDINFIDGSFVMEDCINA